VIESWCCNSKTLRVFLFFLLLKFDYILCAIPIFLMDVTAGPFVLYNSMANRKYSWDWRSDDINDEPYSFSLSKNSLIYILAKPAWKWAIHDRGGMYTHSLYTHTHTHLCVCYMYVVCLWEWESERKREYVWRGIRFELPCTFIDCCAHPTRHEDISLNIAAFELYTAQVYSPPQVLCICIL
jgi:hypothetical protein